MQIASLITGNESSDNWTGPDVLFFDNGAVEIGGVTLSGLQLAEIINVHSQANTKHFQRALSVAEHKPVGTCHDPRPNPAHHRNPYTAPATPYKEQQT